MKEAVAGNSVQQSNEKKKSAQNNVLQTLVAAPGENKTYGGMRAEEKVQPAGENIPWR